MTDNFGGNFLDDLKRFIGTTVTVFTTSGGESGSGFTGVLITVDPCFIRLVSRIGPAPEDPLTDRDRCRNRNKFNRVGSVVEIPIDRIAAFVHSAI
jgi:hypothetical protein